MHRIETAFIDSLLSLENSLLAILRTSLFFRRGINRGRIGRLIVHRVGNIGDTICALPAMKAVRESFPEAYITFLTSSRERDLPGAKDFLCPGELFDEMAVYYPAEIRSLRGMAEFVAKLRGGSYDVFVELPQAQATLKRCLRDMVFAWMIGCKFMVGFEVGWMNMFLKAQERCREFPNEVERLLGLLNRDGIACKEVAFELGGRVEDGIVVDRMLNGPERSSSWLIAMNPGAKRATNRWPRDWFAEVAKELVEEFDVAVVITGGLEDEGVGEWLAGQLGDLAVNAAGKLNINQTAEILRRCNLMVTNDTGAMHMAAAVGTPVVAIFSGRDFPGKWYPYGEGHIVLRKEVGCSPCFKEECETGECLRLISVGEVVEAVRTILRARNGPRMPTFERVGEDFRNDAPRGEKPKET